MDLLDRLHQRLLEAAASSPPAGSYTIGDLYQQLIPYRGIRKELGVWELSQYEHTLLRLLAGERGYLEVADATVREEIQRELRSANPILGIYRDYAGIAVRVPGAPSPAPVPVPGASAEARPDAPHAPQPEPLPGPLPEPVATSRAEPLPADPVVAGAARPCLRCRAALPQAEGLRFCPDCGADQEEVECGHCGAALRAEWNFCIRCGRRRADRPAPV